MQRTLNINHISVSREPLTALQWEGGCSRMFDDICMTILLYTLELCCVGD